MSSPFASTTVFMAVSAYAVGVASPGPSNLAIMAMAMSKGRRHALALAAGVVCGSLVWGLVSAFGLSVLIQTLPWALAALKILGGLYLLVLAMKAARAAMTPHPPELAARIDGGAQWRSFTVGLALHLTNPKAVFIWLSILALGLPPGAERQTALSVVTACALVGMVVFFGYALVFSTETARSAHRKAHRWLNATLSAVFALAGIQLLWALEITDAQAGRAERTETSATRSAAIALPSGPIRAAGP